MGGARSDHRDDRRDGRAAEHLSEADRSVGGSHARAGAATVVAARRSGGARGVAGTAGLSGSADGSCGWRGCGARRGSPMMSGAFNAIVPMACVAAAGIAAMTAEAFRAPDERMPIGGLGIVGLLGAAFGAF